LKPKFTKRPTPAGKFYRLNHFIQARQVRLLDESGKQVGIVTKEEALMKAQAAGVDVVEIAPNANPPVAKLIDYKKFKYLEARKSREEKKKQKNVGVKEVRLSPFIGEHDLKVRSQQAKEFLAEGNQLKISIPFRGRAITRKEFGFEVMRKFIAELVEVKVVREAHFEGKILVAMIAPDKKTSKNEIPVQSTQAV
jgi:translation initiation factor IF-3